MKKLFALTIALLLLFIMTGCSKNTNPEIDPTDKDDKTQVQAIENDENGYIKQLLNTENNHVFLLGAETYTEISGEKNFVDKTETGQEYLVLFLEIENLTWKDDYFHYSYLATELDGKEIETTYLMNNPKGYEPIFNTIPAEDIIQGYIVYKVPVGWEKIKLTYTGWGTEEGQILSFELVREDLKEVTPLSRQ